MSFAPPEAPAPARTRVDVSEVAVANPFVAALNPASAFSPAERRAVDVFVDAGLGLEEAIGLVTRGATASEATDLLSLALLTPTPSRYGPALVALRVIETARAAGGITASQAVRTVAAHARLVVVRPDGYLAPALGGDPIQRSEVRVVGGRLMAGDLPVGAAFLLANGTLYEVDDAYARGRVVGHLGLEHDALNQVLDGFELAMEDLTRELANTIVRLVEDPVEWGTDVVIGFGEIPNAVATLIRKSPELYASFVSMSPADRVRAVSRAVGTFALAFVGAGMFEGAGLAAGGGGLRFASFAGVSGGVLELDAAAAAVGLAALGAGGVLAGTALASIADGVEATPRERWTIGYRVERGVGDVFDRDLYEGPRELRAALEIAERMGPREAALVRRRVAERVAEDLADAAYRDLPELARLREALGDEAKVVDAALERRLKREVAEIRDMPRDHRRTRRVDGLKDALVTAEIDLHRVLRAGGAPPKLKGAAAKAFEDLKTGRKVVYVKTREEAEAIVAQFPDLVDTSGWGFDQIKTLLRRGKDDTVHWDTEFGPNDKIRFHDPDCDHADIAHVQFLSTNGPAEGKFRIEFGERRRGTND